MNERLSGELDNATPRALVRSLLSFSQRKMMNPAGLIVLIMLFCWIVALTPQEKPIPKLVARPEDAQLLSGLERVSPPIKLRIPR